VGGHSLEAEPLGIDNQVARRAKTVTIGLGTRGYSYPGALCFKTWASRASTGFARNGSFMVGNCHLPQYDLPEWMALGIYS
jgi:hypothetical protein